MKDWDRFYFNSDCYVWEEALQPNQSPNRIIEGRVHSWTSDQQGPATLELRQGAYAEDAAVYLGFLLVSGLRSEVTMVDGPVVRQGSNVRKANPDDFSFTASYPGIMEGLDIPVGERFQIVEQFSFHELSRPLTSDQKLEVAAIARVIREARLRWVASQSAGHQPPNGSISAE